MAKTAHFQGQTSSGAANFPILPIFVFLIFAKKFHGRQTSPGANKPLIFPIFLCYSSPSFLVIWNSNLIFTKNFHGRPLRPQLWSQLALTTKTTHFLGQRIPGAGKAPILMIFLWIKLTLTETTAHVQGQTIPEASKHIILLIFLWIQLALMEKTSHFRGQTTPEADLNYGASWPSRPKQPIFKVKRSPEEVNPLFCQFSCAIVHVFFGDLEFQPHFCRNFSWTSVKTSYGASFPSRQKWHVFKVKRAPEQVNPLFCQFVCAISSPSFLVIQNSDLIFAKNFHGYPL
ncbi:hypothetical protein H5410_054496 [Solanum commersonii]|uniref:Uncharacterized protein n=1 Tax=Solanum commersonii TaxID=4109 RepID=A0A9J5WFG6_SOLCO|nr:hypothetical protein H5410_054496 [Solanum commersonii]